MIERQEGDIDEGIYEVPEGATTLHEDEEQELEELLNVEINTDGTLFNDENSRERFNEWAEKYEVNVPYECGAGIYENGQLYEDGFRYQTVMLNTCRHKNKKYTVYME